MSLEEQVERYYIDMENELLLNIAKKVAVDKPMEIDKWSLETNSPIVGSGGVNEWQLERLKELGGLTEENAKIIAKYSKKSKKDIEKIFERAREIGTEVDKKQLELGIKAGILNEIDPVVEDIVVKNIISNAMQETLTTFNKQNNSLLVSSGREYTKIVNTVSTEVMAGTKTVTKAMQDAVTKLAEKGLTGFTARNGAQWSPEAYTKMVLRTNTRQTTNKIQEERMQLAGNNYVEISQHMGARPLCAEDQGKIFSLNDDTTPIEDGLGNKIKVYAWSQSSYGEPAGILGINCGHSRYAFIPGMSIHRERKINKAENDEAYQERQTQRYYERQIRNKKREIEMLKETGAEPDYIKSKQKQLSSFNSQYNSWLKETDRYRDYGNEWIGKISANEEMMITKNIKIGKSNTYLKPIKLSKLPTKYVDSINNQISSTNTPITPLMKKYINNVRISNYQSNEKGSYNTLLKTISFNAKKDNEKNYQTFFHEFSHMIDHKIGSPSQNKDFIKMIYDDFDVFKNKMQDKYQINEDKFYQKMSEKLKKDSNNNSLSDIIGAITKNKCVGRAKHPPEYWENKGKVGREFYAHTGSAMIRESEKETYNFKTIFPNAYKYFEDSLKGK